MGIKINATEATRTSNEFAVWPQDIEVGENPGRAPGERQPEDVERFAKTILSDGQIQAITARRVQGNKLKLVAGWGRHAAFTHINTVLQPDNPIKIRVRVIDCNEEEADRIAIRENFERNDVNIVDKMHIARRMKERYNWSDVLIADYLDMSVSQISYNRRLLQLSKPIQDKVADETLPVSVALDLLEIPEERRETVVAEATDTDTGKVNTTSVKATIRQVREASGAIAKRPRTPKQVKDFFDSLTGTVEPESLQKFAKSMLNFLADKLREDTFEERIRELVTLADIGKAHAEKGKGK